MLHGCLHLIIILPLKIFLSAEIGESSVFLSLLFHLVKLISSD
jgi:hypothetical protein